MTLEIGCRYLDPQTLELPETSGFAPSSIDPATVGIDVATLMNA